MIMDQISELIKMEYIRRDTEDMNLLLYIS